MRQRLLGCTGLAVSAVALGAGHVGAPDQAEADVERLVHRALDLGVNLLDTARSYGASEERLGRALAGRRDAVVISTKVGYGVPGHADWTGPAVTLGVEDALRRLRTDRLDVVHLHSCPLETLRRGEVVAALEATVRAGKARVAAYSGEGDALEWAVRSGAFGSVQLSVNVCDQRALEGPVREARLRGLGVLAKRPLANAPWRFRERPTGHYAEVYWDRLRALRLDPRGLPLPELFARFAAHAPGVASILLGTASPAHLEEAVRAVEAGPLPPELTAALRDAFLRAGEGWIGQV
ncbi:aldo/keto reductase [Anaeromyxobacter oryzae]|uniref:Aldo/keto reductase n=1 Tax=Anaeromyxobacter oryzae TaxID=2918170 RepID=A0ABN6MM42_9BACT|nr:aldo/keto reductase [Anaeromyxobacter oryzae]BDG01330.1 aldo/keto reductase [Anaeromyxobacter oryzae]